MDSLKNYTSVLKSKFPTTNSSLMWVGFIFLFIGLFVYYYFYHIAPRMKPAYTANREQGSADYNSSKQAELLFFYVDWCPHCKTAKPVWEELRSEYQNKTINGYTITFTEVNCTEETAEIVKQIDKYKIEGYPTIKLLKDGQIIEYDAKPSKETLVQFLQTVL